MRAMFIAIAAMAAACTPPAAPTADAPPAPAAADATTQSLLAVLTPAIAAEIGKPVSLQSPSVNVSGEWAYVAAQPRNEDGSEIDWSTTNLASRYENGVMDAGGSAHALLKNENGVWVLVEHVLAPTDVAWADWGPRHGAPAEIFETPATP